jgi:hypothetical protein
MSAGLKEPSYCCSNRRLLPESKLSSAISRGWIKKKVLVSNISLRKMAFETDSLLDVKSKLKKNKNKVDFQERRANERCCYSVRLQNSNRYFWWNIKGY